MRIFQLVVVRFWLGHIRKEWQIKMMAVFFVKKVLNFMRKLKLAHFLVMSKSHDVDH